VSERVDGEESKIHREFWPGACDGHRAMFLPNLIRSGVVSLAATACVVAAQAAVPFRLFELPVSRFTRLDDGTTRLEHAMFNAKRELRAVETFVIGTPPRTSDDAWGKLIVSTEAWFAYQALGREALANFQRLNGGAAVTVGGIPYYIVGNAPEANVGNVVNLSTRGTVGTGSTPTLVGGFVIADQWRRVLIRAVGPSLAPFGVTDAVANPALQLFRGNLSFYFNSDWGQRPDADELARVAAAAGAFPLPPGSKDAALLVELPPGNYTASVTSESTPATGGTALLEIYILP
jgi:hypothetical protein